MPPRSRRWCLVIVLLIGPTASGSPVETFDDIAFWAGSGENRAALVLDWDHASAVDSSRVWGYRWNGAATGEDLLRAIVAADPRLFLRHGPPSAFGLPIYGLGYDLSDDGLFSISSGTSFDSDGLTETGVPDPPPQQPAQATDPGDLYAEGFFTGFWHYAIGDGNPFAGGQWESSLIGVSSRVLSDGDWDSWTFESPPQLVSTAFPQNPVPAESPFSADFDLDDDIDGFDFQTWQRGFGTTHQAPAGSGDANGDQRVDDLDLSVWLSTYGTTSALRALASIPEPLAMTQVFTIIPLLALTRSPRRHCS